MWDDVAAAEFEEYAAICHDDPANTGYLCPNNQGPG